jgi:hypothetical protein
VYQRNKPVLKAPCRAASGFDVEARSWTKLGWPSGTSIPARIVVAFLRRPTLRQNSASCIQGYFPRDRVNRRGL